MNPEKVSLAHHLHAEAGRHEAMPDVLRRLLERIAAASTVLTRAVARASIDGTAGLAGGENSTGDAQKTLDVLGNEIVLREFEGLDLVCAVVSEELQHPRTYACCPGAPYILVTDPLDGSSNTANGGSVGTIFGVHRAPDGLTEEAIRDAVAGEPLAAGYVLYGASTVLVYSAGKGVHGFTLDRDVWQFLLTHEDIRCPLRGRTLSANLGHVQQWSDALREYVAWLGEVDPEMGRPYSLRYSGALVADLHRCLLEGGLYLYPADLTHPEGKLRRVYECAPLAFVMKQAGGRAVDWSGGALESLHQRSSLILGSESDVRVCETFLRGDPTPHRELER